MRKDKRTDYIRSELRLTTRSASLRTFNAEQKSMVVTATSETSAMVFDWETADMVNEVLMSDGFRMPAKGVRIPFLDAHNRGSIMNVLGSAGNFQSEEGGLVSAEVFFANTPEAERAMGLYKEKHLTDVSISYTIDKHEMIPDGKTKKYKGREFVGPMRLVTQYTIKELSSVPIGADPAAKARAECNKQEEPMNPFQLWLAAGSLDEKTLDAQKLAGLRAEFDAEQNPPPKPAPVQTPVATPPAPVVPSECAEDVIERVRQIELAGRGLGIDQVVIDSVKFTAKTEQEAGRAYMKELAKKSPPVPPDIRMMADGEVKFRAAASDGLLMAAGLRFKDAAPGADQLSRLGFEGMARECLRRRGIDTSLMGREEILRKAHTMGTRAAFPGMDSADFPYILANSANKAVVVGYGMAPTTYQQWCKIASVRDFKSNSRVRLSDVGVLEQVTAQGELHRGNLSEEEEHYRIYTYGKILGITREMQINDDLNVFANLFQAFGFSTARTINAVPYAILAANANMADGGALFNSTAVTSVGGHANLATVAANPGSTSFSAARAAMRKQVGPKGMKLNLTPQFAICGPDNEDNLKIVLTSTTIPLVDMPQGVTNPNQNTASPIVDSEITGNAWYLAVNPNLEPTIEMGFLNGQQTPNTELRPVSGDILGTDFWCYIDFSGKAIGWRGLYKNAGG